MSTPALLDLPAEVSAGQVVTVRGEFAVLMAGTGPLALFVPGWTGSKEDFGSVLAPLAAAGYHVVSLDLRGQYQTAGVADPAAYSPDALADDLLALLDSLGADSAHLVGHSFGGLVSRALALRHPRAVRSLTLLCSGPAALPPDRHRLLLAMAQMIDEHGLEVTWQAKSAYARTQGLDEAPPRVEMFLQHRFLANHPISLREMTIQLTTATDLVSQLAATEIPTMVAFGEHDDGWPLPVQAEMADRLNTRAVSIAGAGHSPAVDQPAATVALLTEFWGGRATPRLALDGGV